MFRKTFQYVALFAFFASPTLLSAQQRPSWTSDYLKAEKADQLSVCIAIVAYSNASFMVRLYQERLDFLYRRNDFTLPYGEVLGIASFVIDGQIYQTIASTFSRGANDTASTAQVMQLIPNEDEVANLFSALRYGSSFHVVFPNGDSYGVSLAGSSNALAAASNCWDRNPTGPISNNPFGSGDGTADQGEVGGAANPFDDT